MKLKLKWKIIFGIMLAIGLIFTIMKLDASFIRIKEYKVVNKNISSFYGFKIVHFSDLYYGKNLNDKKLEKLVNMINDTKPDIVIFTGNLIDSRTTVNEDISKSITTLLNKINSTLGKYYVNGNLDNNISMSILEDSGFKSIDDSYEILYGENGKSMFISGLSIDKTLNSDLIEKLNLNDYTYKILASHYPDKIDEVKKYNFNLIVSGHSLNGQFRLPGINGIIKFKNAKKYNEPYYKLDNTDFYISNGISSKINLRLFNTPSFNLYRLVDK